MEPLQGLLFGEMAAPINVPAPVVIAAPVADQKRLTGQYERVEWLMRDGAWHTLPQLARDLKSGFRQLYSETSISARIRDMRKRGWQIECNRSKPGSGLFQYRATPATETLAADLAQFDALMATIAKEESEAAA